MSSHENDSCGKEGFEDEHGRNGISLRSMEFCSNVLPCQDMEQSSQSVVSLEQQDFLFERVPSQYYMSRMEEDTNNNSMGSLRLRKQALNHTFGDDSFYELPQSNDTILRDDDREEESKSNNANRAASFSSNSLLQESPMVVPSTLQSGLPPGAYQVGNHLCARTTGIGIVTPLDSSRHEKYQHAYRHHLSSSITFSSSGVSPCHTLEADSTTVSSSRRSTFDINNSDCDPSLSINTVQEQQQQQQERQRDGNHEEHTVVQVEHANDDDASAGQSPQDTISREDENISWMKRWCQNKWSLGLGLIAIVLTVSSLLAVLQQLVFARRSTNDDTSDHGTISVGSIVDWTDLIDECQAKSIIDVRFLSNDAVERFRMYVSVYRSLVVDPPKNNDDAVACDPQNLALLAMSIVLDLPVPPEPDFTRFGLSVFFFAMQGQKWHKTLGWLSAADPCNWISVQCDVSSSNNSTNTQVEKLELQSNNLMGSSLPTELYLVTTLQHLSLRTNAIGGSVSPRIAQLSNLTHLALQDTFITGSLPLELFTSVPNLKFLGLPDNARGEETIPTWTMEFKNGPLPLSLESLVLDATHVTDRMIPSELGLLAQLTSLHFTGELHGTIPTQVAAIPRLESLVLSPGRLSGSLPHELFDINNATLSELVVNRNSLSGSIPTLIGRLTNLKRMDLFDNSLTGTLPSEVGLCSSLEKFDVGFNDLVGTIPTELGNLQRLESLTLDQNRLTGTVPTEIATLQHLLALEISAHRGLTGSLSPEFFCLNSSKYPLIISMLPERLGDGDPLLNSCLELSCCQVV